MVWRKFDRYEDQSGLLVIRDSRATNCLKTGFAKLVRNYAFKKKCFSMQFKRVENESFSTRLNCNFNVKDDETLKVASSFRSSQQ